jgi:hypothetical protein
VIISAAEQGSKKGYDIEKLSKDFEEGLSLLSKRKTRSRRFHHNEEEE